MFALAPEVAGVWVALITTMGLIVVAIIQNRHLKTRAAEATEAAKLAAWGTAVQGEKVLDAVRDNVGTPNGRGNVVEMLERLDERTAATHELLQEHIRKDEAVQEAQERALQSLLKRVPPVVDPPVRGPGRVFPLSPYRTPPSDG